MVAFPASPIPPAEFMETVLPEVLAAAGLPEGAEDLTVRLGVRLEGEGGGEWLLEIGGGAVRVVAGSRKDAAFTYAQSVEDWRGALWEGRGGAIGRAAAGLFRPGARAGAGGPAGGPGLGAAPTPAALEAMRSLSGVVRMVVSDEGEGAGSGAWWVDLVLGPGEIPAEPTTTVHVSAADAEAMERGELDPMQAFMAGRIRVEGDMTLMLQMQAAQMQAAGTLAGGPGRS